MSSGLSQGELAARAGVSQPMISAYERGRREPSIATLSRLVAAAGCELEIDVRPVEEPGRAISQTSTGLRLRGLREEIIDAAAAKGATNVRVFGSVARGDETEESDLDLLVDIDSGVGLIALMELEEQIEGIVGRPVDVVPAHLLKDDVARRAFAEAVVLWEAI